MIKEGVFLGKRYEILGRIGSGGMADVYKGKDHKLNRFVAIKVLKSDYRSDETFIKKFLSEAQAAAGLMHPNVVNVYDVGQDRGEYYYFERRKSKGNRFRYCTGDYVYANDQHQCNGIRSLYITGAGKRRNCR